MLTGITGTYDDAPAEKREAAIVAACMKGELPEPSVLFIQRDGTVRWGRVNQKPCSRCGDDWHSLKFCPVSYWV